MARAKYEVCGEYPIVEYDDEWNPVRDVPPGEVVEINDLNPKVNIPALIMSGNVKPAAKVVAPKANKES